MQANYISVDLAEKLEKSGKIEGTVSSIYPTLFTVITEDDELIYFLNNKKYIAPMSIVLEDLCSFEDLNLSQDTKVLFTTDKITIEPNKIEVCLSSSETWNPKTELLMTKTCEELIEKNLSIVEDAVFKHGKYEGFAPLIYSLGEYIEELRPINNHKIHNNLYSSFISEKIIEFLFEIVNGDLSHIAKTTEEFLGFGPGITPSSDDFLCGFMIAFVYMGHYYDLDLKKIFAFNKRLLEETALDKEDLSHNLLMQYSRGNSQKMIKQFINSILYETDEEEMYQSTREVISFGDISGTDIVCGIYLGTRLIRHENIKRQFRIQ